MKFVNVRELRIHPGEVWNLLHQNNNLVLTSNGKPFAFLIETDENNFEEHLTELRRANARIAVSSMRAHARKSGLNKLSTGKIDEIIQQTRSKRKTSSK
jgi:hypothetical protein